VATKPAVPRRGRPPRHNRGDILDAASEVLIFRGYEATRYSDVAEASGVPIASIQHHFPAIEVLRREALRHKVRSELSDLANHVRGIDDPWERIRHIIIRSVSLEPARRRGGWIVWLEYWRAAAHDPALARDSELVNEQWLDLITWCVADGVGAEMFQLEGTPREAATELHALLDGLGIRLAVDHPPQVAADSIALLERAARRMLFRA
jgi:AcrR family transcriptional regulator